MPQRSTMIHATGMIVRPDAGGDAGISFTHISNTDRWRILLDVADERQRRVPAS